MATEVSRGPALRPPMTTSLDDITDDVNHEKGDVGRKGDHFSRTYQTCDLFPVKSRGFGEDIERNVSWTVRSS